MPRTEAPPVHCFHRLDQSVRPGQQVRPVHTPAENRMSPHAPEDHQIVPREYARHRAVRWLLLGPHPDQERSKARLRPRTDTFRHPVLPAPALRLQPDRRGRVHPLKERRQPVQPCAPPRKDQGAKSPDSLDAVR